MVLRHSVVLVLGYSYSVVLYRRCTEILFQPAHVGVESTFHHETAVVRGVEGPAEASGGLHRQAWSSIEAALDAGLERDTHGAALCANVVLCGRGE